MADTINYRFKVAGKAAATLTSENPTPFDREIVIETDTAKIKLGNGADAWTSLAYFYTWTKWGRATGTLSDQTDLQSALDAKQPLDSDLTAWAGKTAPSGAAVGTTDTQTLTNKTLGSPTMTGTAGMAAFSATGNGAVQGALTVGGNGVNGKVTFNRSDGASNLASYEYITSGDTLRANSNNGGFHEWQITGTSRLWLSAAALYPGSDNAQSCGTSGVRWSVIYAATGSISTSDARAKREISPIPDTWLDAWGDVEWCRFKFRDAAATKGAGARWHVGLIAQAVRDAFAKRGLDALAIGLLCYDEWEAQHSPIIGKRGRALKRADVVGNRWGLRYDECFAMEAAYQRRRIDRIERTLAS
jgi:hypothetical protein